MRAADWVAVGLLGAAAVGGGVWFVMSKRAPQAAPAGVTYYSPPVSNGMVGTSSPVVPPAAQQGAQQGANNVVGGIVSAINSVGQVVQGAQQLWSTAQGLFDSFGW